MINPRAIYESLIDYASLPDPVREVVIGPIWTLCRTDRGIGLAMSPQIPTRTLEWPGTLCGRPVSELAAWLAEWEPYQAAVGMAATNAALADLSPPPESIPVTPGSLLPPNLSVFEHFLPELAGKRVVVVGRYPGLARLGEHCRLSVLERSPGFDDFPDPACEFLLPEADWVFLTGSSLTNKTFPRLAELSRSARSVLMGPTVPWLPELADFGIDVLAGVEVVDPEALRRTVAEGGGVRIFDGPVGYRLAELGSAHRLEWLKQRIARVFAEKERLSALMDQWYRERSERFPEFDRLESAHRRLSRLDSAYKPLWDARQAGS
ncbi:DUF364 domain-containing protein [Methylocaldum sp.]|uniref:DUF364 domain-containing protein n=1 Tax=Methylocaldum sp. TaxID=1969727 RepID=UPI002D53AB33|nr:DUF364 domain-containing protein [Methylocaldum sp.]HYE37481.1 DUF364 domain-containing protein [Methylocaldum sp.]